jgi:hypothetical protein
MLTTEYKSSRGHRIALGCAMGVCAFASSIAIAASFNAQVGASNVKIQSIFSGRYGPTYITFTSASLTGCYLGVGGYLSSTWPEAMLDVPADPEISKRQLSTVMLAKSMDATLTIYYRVNTSGTGWDKCAIDSIWIQ